MAELVVDDVTPGTVLQKAAVDFTGAEIFPAGTVLRVQHIKTLREWGVKTVEVRGEDELQAQELSEQSKVYTEKLERLKGRFEGQLNNPFMMKLYEAEQAVLQSKLRGK